MGVTLTKEQKALAEKQTKEIQKKLKALTKEDVLTDAQLELYKTATEQRRKWLEFYLRNGDPNAATKFAYPNHSVTSAYVTSHTLMKYWDISIGDLFRAMGIGELKIAKKTNTLLDAKRTTRTFIKGDLKETVTEEDNYAIGKGLDIAIKLTGNEPASKRLVGEDPNNRFRGLADLMKAQFDEDDDNNQE